MELRHHDAFLHRLVRTAENDARIAGIAVGGSYAAKTMDTYSDLDVVVVGRKESQAELFEARIPFAESIGSMLSAFTGEHVGEPRLLICLYGPPLLHVDLKFVSLDEFGSRIEDPVIVWERDGVVTHVMQSTQPHYPGVNLQWIEDRIWTWFHYGATKLGRGELFEFMDMTAYLRSAVFGPMIRARNGTLPRGVRNIEREAEADVQNLVSTVAVHNRLSCAAALQASIALYETLRSHFLERLHINHAVESAVKTYCAETIRTWGAN